MRESRTYGSVRGAYDETHVPTATQLCCWLKGMGCSCHDALWRSMALRAVIIFRMTATMMTLGFFSARRGDRGTP